MACHARTRYVVSMDDDICFAHSEVLATLVDLLGQQSETDRLLGAEGVRLGPNCPYAPEGRSRCRETASNETASVHYYNVREDQQVDIVKGRVLAGRTSAIRGLPMWHVDGSLCDDIVVSGLLANGRPAYHLLPCRLRDCFSDLPDMNGPMSLCQIPGWKMIREHAKRKLFKF